MLRMQTPGSSASDAKYDGIVAAARHALLSVLEIALTVPLDARLNVRWTRGDGGSCGRTELVPSIDPVFLSSAIQWEALSADLGSAIAATSPQYLGMIGGAAHRTRFDASMWLQSLVAEMWRRHGRLEATLDEVGAIAEAFGHLLSSGVMRRRFVAPMANLYYEGDIGEIDVAGVLMRKMDDEEFNSVYGGPVGFPRPGRAYLGMPEIALVGELEEQIQFGDMSQLPADDPVNALRQRLDRAVLALRTFKAGPVGYTGLHLLRGTISILGLEMYPVMTEYVPIGQYCLTEKDVESLRAHAALYTHSLHPALQIACDRLATAAVRAKPRDRLMDAIIGLEATILYKISDEVSFRFALNYAAIFGDPDDRYSAFLRARSLYSARSKIAHGEELGEVKLDGRPVPIGVAADIACDMLRQVVARFLAHGTTPQFTESAYYEKAYFCVAEGVRDTSDGMRSS